MLELYFIGTGTPTTRGQLNEGGFLLRTDKTVISVDPGPGAAQTKQNVNAIVLSSPERGHDALLLNAPIKEQGKIADIDVVKKENGLFFRTPDGTISYVTEKIKMKDIKNYTCDVLILYGHYDEKLILKIKPRLTLLTGFAASIENPLYIARDLQKKTNRQVISAKDGLTVDLRNYSALSEQKGLGKYS